MMSHRYYSRYGGTIFSGCHNFTVAGGIFNSTTKNYISVPSVPPG
jgi:hypothetical protein